MSERKLKFVSASVVTQLQENVEANLHLYSGEGFSSLARDLGWALETTGCSIKGNFGGGLILDKTPDAEIDNSLHVYESLIGLTPALARDERIWVRLCHLEGLPYARERWISEKSAVRSIELHFFAKNLTQCRDDNAIGRLWWNGFIAKQIDPGDPKSVLEQMLKRANIRLQFVDRANTSFRMPLARGLIRLLKTEGWLDSHDRAFENYIRVLDRNGGGRVYEASSDAEIDAFLRANLTEGKEEHDRRLA